MYTLTLTQNEMDFFRQLFDSQLAVTIQNVEVIAELKKKIREAPVATPEDFPTLHP